MLFCIFTCHRYNGADIALVAWSSGVCNLNDQILCNLSSKNHTLHFANSCFFELLLSLLSNDQRPHFEVIKSLFLACFVRLMPLCCPYHTVFSSSTNGSNFSLHFCRQTLQSSQIPISRIFSPPFFIVFTIRVVFCVCPNHSI